MNLVIGIAIGVICTVVLGWAILMAFASGLAGRTPLLLRPIQMLLFGEFMDRVKVIFGLAVIVVVHWLLANHVNISFK